MRRLPTIAAIMLSVLIGTGPMADAQVKLKTQVLPRVATQPKPVVKFIPPSVAVTQALRMVPNGTPLNVRLSGGRYLVKIKTGDKVRVVPVDAVSGDISP